MQLIEELLAKIRNRTLNVPMAPYNRTKWEANLQAGYEFVNLAAVRYEIAPYTLVSTGDPLYKG